MNLERKFENPEMEAVVLGTILANGEILYSVADVISENCFSDSLNKSIFNHAKQLLDSGERLSPVRLINKYPELNRDVSYIKILAGKASPITLRTNIKHLLDLHHRREVFITCQTIMNKVTEFDKSGIDFANILIESTTKIISSGITETISIVDAATQIYEEMKSGVPAYMAKTGLKILDLATNGGFQQGRVYAFMAAAKCGKTMLATTISSHLCENGHKHLFVCAEMGSKEITQRMLGKRLGVASNAFLGRSDKKLIDRLAEEIPKLRKNIIFADEPGIDFDTLKLLVDKHVYKDKIEGFILDYYQLVGGCEKGQTQAMHLENIANWIHRICKKHNIWCLLLVQTNDESKVLGSRGLNRACDQGFMIERPLDDKGDPFGRLAWLKHRFSRYTKIYNLGNETDPSLVIHENGTHFEEILK